MKPLRWWPPKASGERAANGFLTSTDFRNFHNSVWNASADHDKQIAKYEILSSSQGLEVKAEESHLRSRLQLKSIKRNFGLCLVYLLETLSDYFVWKINSNHLYFFSYIFKTDCVVFLFSVRPFLSPSGDLGIGLVWHNLSPLDPTGPHPTPPQLFGPTVEILFKLN